MMNNIRQLSPLDALAFQVLRLKAVETDPQAFLSTPEFEQAKTLQQYTNELVFARLIPPFGYYGAFEDQSLVGFCQLGTTGLTKQKHIAYLYNLYIDPLARRRHLADQLFQVVSEVAQSAGIERLFANCLRQNPAALAFYQKHGFEVCGERVKSVKLAEAYDNEIELVKVL